MLKSLNTIKKFLCNDSAKHHEIRKCTVNGLSKYCCEEIFFISGVFKLLMESKLFDSIEMNSDETYLFEGVSGAYNTTKAANNYGLLCVAHDNDVESLQFNRKHIPITSAKFFVKQVELIGHHFT